MRFPTRYLSKLKADPRPKLFGYKSPGAVRLRALQLLEDRSDDDFLVRHAQRDSRDYQPRRDLLAGWHDDGSWGSDRFYMRRWGETAARDKALLTTARNLTLLHLYGWRPDEDYSQNDFLDEAAELLLSRARDDGHLQLLSPDNTRIADEDKSLASRADHWPGIAVAALMNFGVADPRIKRFLDLLEREQRPDGGWLPALEARRHVGEEQLPSHPLHTANFALALSTHPERRDGEAARRAASFLLDHAFRAVGGYRKAGLELWEQLAEPQWGFDTLKVLWIALNCGVGPQDTGVNKLVKWLIEAQASSGLWRSARKRPGPDEDLFLTLRATAAVKKVYDDLAGDE